MSDQTESGGLSLLRAVVNTIPGPWQPSVRLRAILLVALLDAVAGTAHAGGVKPPSASPPEPAAQEDPVRVRVAVDLLSIGKLDIGEGSYTMDFYLSFRCDRPCEPGRFEFTNGRAASVSKQDDTPQLKVYRVLAELNANFNLRSFPFDSHDLFFGMEDELLTASELVYEVDTERTAVAGDLIVAGWRVDRGWQASTSTSRYASLDGEYSRYRFSISISRPLQYSLLKNLLPGAIIVVVGLLALLIGPRFMLERLTVSGSALLGAILYHLEVTAMIPPLPYLTFTDRFTLINYAALGLTVGSSVALIVLEQRGREAAVMRIQTGALRSIPLLWLVLQSINAIIH